MSDIKDIKNDPIEKIKEIPVIQKEMISPLLSGVKDLRGKIQNTLGKLNDRKKEIIALREESEKITEQPYIPETKVEIPTTPKVDEVIAVEETPIPKTTKKSKKAEEKIVESVEVAKQEVAIEPSVSVVEKKEDVAKASPVIEKTAAPKTEDKSATPTVKSRTEELTSSFVVKHAPLQPKEAPKTQNTYQGRQYVAQDNRQGGYNNRNNNERNQGQGGYQGNRPNNTQGGYQGSGYQGNRPNNAQGQGGYQGNRPNNTQGGYQGNRPNNTQGGYQGNRPNNAQGQGGYQGNRPNNAQGQGGFNNQNRPNGNRTFGILPKGDIPLPLPTKDVNLKKKKTVDKDDSKKQANKRTLVRKGFNSGFDDDNVKHVKLRRGKKQESFTPIAIKIENAVVTTQEVPIKILAERIGKQAVDIVKKLFEIGQAHTINSIIDFDSAELIASEFGVTLEYRPDKSAEDKLFDIVADREIEGEMEKRPPVVTIMGHVDHGKTSLLDRIRESKVASGEAGGITQHIGAYTIEYESGAITFLDTPGHEAFTSMRKRGAMVTDIAIIVVAADDGIMPQTIEAISHAKEAGVSIIIAINKMDKQDANPDKILQQLTQYDIVPEEWGGDVMVCRVSAKTGAGIKELMDTIHLVADIKELKAVKDGRATGSIVEAKLDKGVGPVATVLIQSGTLKVSDYVVAGTCTGKVRAMINDAGNRVKEATPSYAVSVQGFSEVPNAGDQLIVVKDEKLAKQVAEERAVKDREERQRMHVSKNLEDMFKGVSATEMKNLGIIIKGDVQGSVEAVKQAMVKLSEEMSDNGVKLTILHATVGAINESDVMLADTANSMIIGFNVRPEPKAKALAEKNKVDIRIYRIIYDAIDDVTRAMKGMLDPIFREEELGHAEVRETFRITGVGTIAGCYVTDGKVQRNAKFRLIRDNIVVFEGSISSMKRNKDEVKEVAHGYECGIGLNNFNDMKIGDIIEAFLLKEEAIK